MYCIPVFLLNFCSLRNATFCHLSSYAARTNPILRDSLYIDALEEASFRVRDVVSNRVIPGMWLLIGSGPTDGIDLTSRNNQPPNWTINKTATPSSGPAELSISLQQRWRSDHVVANNCDWFYGISFESHGCSIRILDLHLHHVLIILSYHESYRSLQ